VITIVSGLPRSGTSLMMQMLVAGGIPALTDQIRTADEDNPRGYFEFEAVKRTKHDPSWLGGADGKVVKMVHLLLYDLPQDRQYRVLFMRRNIREVLASQRKMLQRQGKPGAALPDEQLAAVFEDQLRKLFGWLESRPNFAVLQVDYNALVSRPAEVIETINAFCGGTLSTAAMAATIDPSLYRNRA